MDELSGRALVAGGAGFLGSHLCEALLADGWTVTCLDNLQTGRRANLAGIADHPRFDFVLGDVSEPIATDIADRRWDEIYNLACAASPPAYQHDPEHTMMTNVVGTRHLLRLAEACDARFLLTSTSEVYGDPLQHPQTESYRGNVNPVGPRACYDEGKRAAETLAFDFDRHDRAKVRVARIFNTYGPRLDPCDGRVVSNMVTQALAGQALTIYGTGEQTRSFCFVDDMVRGLIALMRNEGPQPGPVNLGNPIEITMLQLAGRVVALGGGERALVHLPLPIDDPQRRRPDIAFAGRLLGWKPLVGLDEGLSATFSWFAQQSGRVDTPVMAAPELALAL